MDTIVNLIERIKNRASIPAQQERFTDSYFVELIKEELESSVIPYICGLNEEFFVIKQRIDYTTYSKYPQGYLPIPRRAFARGVRQLMVGERPYFPSASGFGTPEQPGGFIFENDSILFRSPERNVSDWIMSYFYKVPNITLDATVYAPITDVVYCAPSTVTYALVPVTAGVLTVPSPTTIQLGQLVNITQSTGVITQALVLSKGVSTVTVTASNGSGLISIPTSTVTSVKFLAGAAIYTLIGTQTNFPKSGPQLYDVYKKSTGSYLQLDLTTYNLTVTPTSTYDNICFTTELSTDDVQTLNNNQQGGYSSLFSKEMVLLPADVNCFSPIPAEIDNLLTSCVVDRLLEALGDTEGKQNNAQIMLKCKESLTMAFGKRMQGASVKVIPGNRHQGSAGWSNYSSTYYTRFGRS